MDTLLNQRWQAGLPPFDGDCLVTDGMISVDNLRMLLAIVLPELKGDDGGRTLYTFDDWHQHDGYVTNRQETEWSSLESLARNNDLLVASRQGDDYVHRSFYPENLSCLLRFDVPDKDCGDGTGLSGTFDLSASPPKIARILSILPLTLRTGLRLELSKGYFDRTYAG
ncbi:MAG TPA: hypothetical protein VNX28_10930 [Gemmataceae bacterium]|jgi:hypothetical protein|nr:hypothetical protein [Gemmataceae bacterium]